MFSSEGLPIFRFIMDSEFFLDTEEGKPSDGKNVTSPSQLPRPTHTPKAS